MMGRAVQDTSPNAKIAYRKMHVIIMCGYEHFVGATTMIMARTQHTARKCAQVKPIYGTPLQTLSLT
jgi:hypothetical protein